MKNNYTLTYHDGSTDEIDNEELAVLEESVDFVSYKRTYSHNYNTVAVEIGASVSVLGLKKTLTFCRQKAEYEAKIGAGL